MTAILVRVVHSFQRIHFAELVVGSKPDVATVSPDAIAFHILYKLSLHSPVDWIVLGHVQVFTVFKFAVFSTKDPREHLPSFHRCPYDPPVLVPVHAPLALGESQLEADLRQDAHQEFVHVMVDSYRDLDEFSLVGARQAFAVCETKKN